MMDSPLRDQTHFVRCLKCGKILQCSRYDTATLLQHIRNDHPEIEIVANASPTVDAAASKAHASDGPTVMDFEARVGGGGGGGGDVCGEVCGDACGDVCVTNFKEINEEPCGGIKRCPAGAVSAEALLPSMSNETIAEPQPPKSGRRRSCSETSEPQHEPQTPSGTPQRRALYRASIAKWRPGRGLLFCPQCGEQMQPIIRSRTERFTNHSCGTACLLGCWPFCFLPFICSGSGKEYLHCSNCKCFLGLYDRAHNCVRPNRIFVESVESLCLNAVDNVECSG